MRVGELLGMLVEAILNGEEATARQYAEGLAAVAEKGGVPGLAGPLQSAVSGKRDVELTRGLGPVGHAVITTILAHLTPLRLDRAKDGTSLSDRISALSEQKAISALVLVLRAEGQDTDARTLREAEPRLIEALQQSALRDLIEPDLAATPGSLARTALKHLSARDETTRNYIWLALAMAGSDQPDIGSPEIGVLALLAFTPEMHLEDEPGRGWTFPLQGEPAENSAQKHLLAQLLGLYLRSWSI
jgi:hypothetical protein